MFERDDRIGGLLRYGIPEFKMEKAVLDRRLKIMEQEGIMFQTNANVGVDVTRDALQRDFDAIVLACGATAARDLPIPGRELKGIHFAMEYLPQQNRKCEGDTIADDEFISAAGKHVVIIGGGDTGADCLGTAHRQGAQVRAPARDAAASRRETRTADNPWPQWPQIFRVSSAHEEGGERLYAVSTTAFIGDDEGA